MRKRHSPAELFGCPASYEERQAKKKLKQEHDFSEFEISLAMKNVRNSDEFITGMENLEEVMPELVVKVAARLSEQNGGNLG